MQKVDQPVVLPRVAKGRKPIYFDSVTDKLISISLALMGELSVTRDRLDTVERLIERSNLFSQDDIDEFKLQDSEELLRAKRRSEYVARILKSVQDDLENIDQQQSLVKTHENE